MQLKDIYNTAFFDGFTQVLAQLLPAFDKQKFLAQIYNDQWEHLELKARMRHIANVLKTHLAQDYTSSITQLLACVDLLEQNGITEQSLEYMFLPDFIETNGLEHCELSLQAMERLTQYTSCEFAIRPFIIRYPDQVLAQMKAWAQHQNQHLRRLASEGCRPRLPWAMALPALKKDPTPILPILETLKQDESEYVRRSVANNLNDIAKDHPALVVEIAQKWKGLSPETDKLVKHASRTLLKQGNQTLMQLFGFGAIDDIALEQFQILTPQVTIGDALAFSFQITNKAKKNTKIRLEYALYYLKANGSHSKKVFKISEKEYAAQSVTAIERKQSFKIITTRKFYPGEHKLSLIINGIEQADLKAFYLNA